MNVLTFSVMVSGIIIVTFWFLHDALPQIVLQRKLDKTARLAEESRRAYLAARENEITTQLRVPKSIADGWYDLVSGTDRT